MRLAVVVRKLDYNIFIATSPSDISRLTTGIIPHLTLLDISMPPMAGHTCLEALRANRSLAIMKVVMVGEGSQVKELEALTSKGANAYLARPIGPTELYQSIHAQIEPHPRKVPRIKVIFKATVVAGSSGRSTYATAISEQGVFIRTLKPMQAGTIVRVTLDLPTPKPLVFEGEVIYSVAQDIEKMAEPGMGIRFINIDSELKMGLRRFVEEQLMGEASDIVL